MLLIAVGVSLLRHQTALETSAIDGAVPRVESVQPGGTSRETRAGSERAHLPPDGSAAVRPDVPDADRPGQSHREAKPDSAWSLTAGIDAAAHDAAERRRAVVRDLPDLQGRTDDLENTVEDASVLDGLPRGTRFAATFHASATTVDGSKPIVEKNTVPDGNDGIYFPPDAELAYPNRAGVDGEVGTIALWVEPVDWEGRDASVHSFFRLNDPNDKSYRFHLLKDSADLRFQFITENGETNVRVPIDWWPRGEGHHLAATWNNNVLRLHVDGVVLSEQPYQGTLQVPANVPGWWGSRADGGTPGAGAVLKDTLVTGRPLADAEIQQLWEGNQP